MLLLLLLPAECVLAPLLPKDSAALTDWTLLVLYLAEQYYYIDRDLPLPSKTWAPYLQSLPRHPVGTILDWPTEEVSKYMWPMLQLHMKHFNVGTAVLLLCQGRHG